MKSGLVVYLVGGAELPEGFDLARHCKEIGFPADRVELVGSRQGFFEVEDAGHFLNLLFPQPLMNAGRKSFRPVASKKPLTTWPGRLRICSQLGGTEVPQGKLPFAQQATKAGDPEGSRTRGFFFA